MAYDELYAKVSLLLQMDGVNLGTSFPDSSNTKKTVTAEGGAVTYNGKVKFGTCSGFFSAGTADYLTVSSANSLLIGTDDFTVEVWLYISGLSPPGTDGFRSAHVLRASDDTAHLLYIIGTAGSTGTGIGIYDGTHFDSVAQSISSAWHHIAQTRQAGTLRYFFDGTLIRSTTYEYSLGSVATVNIGGCAATDPRYLTGYMSNLRVTIGSARYTDTFSVPTAAFPTAGYPPPMKELRIQSPIIKTFNPTIFNG